MPSAYTDMAKIRVKQLPARVDVATEDTWDLSSLFSDDASWEQAFEQYASRIDGYEQFRGKLRKDAKALAACLAFDLELDRLAERLGIYAHLKTSEDQANSHYQGMMARFQNVAVNAGQLASYIRPEILAIPKVRMGAFLKSRSLKPYRLLLLVYH